MPFTLSQIVPWGRSFNEYVRMFALTDADLERSILGCGDGPAAFNVGLTQRGGRVVSCDPLYEFTAEQIEARVHEVYPKVREQNLLHAADFVWDYFQSVDDLCNARMASMRLFLEDYPQGTADGRYVNAELPKLPFADGQFSLAVCSHLLFLYSDHLTLEFHHASLVELCRVAEEVRIFPILKLGGTPSPYVETLAQELRAKGHSMELARVPYEFMRGGHTMMKIARK